MTVSPTAAVRDRMLWKVSGTGTGRLIAAAVTATARLSTNAKMYELAAGPFCDGPSARLSFCCTPLAPQWAFQ